MENGNNNTVHVGSSTKPKRFVPTCPICGNEHWPKDPSCTGKKGSKTKAKAKGSAKAKARAERLGTAPESTYQTPEVEVNAKSVSPSVEPVFPSFASIPNQPANVTTPAKPKLAPQPSKPQDHADVNIKARSYKEITSFEDELARIKRQADEVILRTSEDATHRVNAERTARINAEEKASTEAAARLKAEEKLHAEIEKNKKLQEQLQKLSASNTPQPEKSTPQATAEPSPANTPQPLFATEQQRANTSKIRLIPSFTSSNVGTLLSIRASDIMETDVLWVKPDDTIAEVLEQMLANDGYYAIVVDEGRVEGIVSRTELTGPVCEFLKPFMSKWQRPGTDAAFNIAVKWIMSKQVNYVTSNATCTEIMKKMRALNMCPLPVVEDSKVIGIVTPFNVFKIRALLKLESDNNARSNSRLIQELPARINSYMAQLNAAKTSMQQPTEQTQP